MLSDLRFAFRLLTKSPGFTFVAVLTLALGIATATTMFSFYNAVLVRAVPFIQDEDRVVTVRGYTDRQLASNGEIVFSQPDFIDVRKELKTLTGLLIVQERTYILGTGDRPDRIGGEWITPGAFTTLGVQPILGRDFRLDEEKSDAPPVAILGYSVWKKNFGGRPEVIGETAVLNGETVTIVGVMPEGFRFERNSDLWMPFHFEEKEQERGNHSYPAYARLAPGVSLEQAQAELETISARLAAEYPNSNAGMHFRAKPIHEAAVQDDRTAFQFMLGAVIMVLLIACANVANLLLSRSTARAREIAVRAALGAPRGRLVRQLLTESLLLGLAGGCAGVVLSFWGIDLVLGLIPIELPFWFNADIDWHVMLFALGASLASALLFGLLPALKISKPDLAHELKDGARGSSSGESHRIRSALVVVQLAVALVLLVGAGLFMRSFLHLLHGDPGVDPKNVLTFRTGLPPTQYKDHDANLTFFARLNRDLAAAPGVEAAGLMSYLPSSPDKTSSTFFYVEGRPVPKVSTASDFAIIHSATPGALEALHIPLQQGRMFDARDVRPSQPVAIVDAAFAQRFFPRGDAIGHRITFDNPNEKIETWHVIVGIVGNARQNPTSSEPEYSIWTCLLQKDENFVSAVIRLKAGDLTSFVPTAQDLVAGAQSGIPIYWVKSMEDVVTESLWRERFLGGVFAIFAGVALFLAAIGIYGVMAYSVSQRTQEIGVRMALGSPPELVIRMVLRQGARLVVAGLGAGFAISWFVAILLESQLHGIEAHDPPTFALVPLLLAAVALFACYLPSRRATLIAPLVALRME